MSRHGVIVRTFSRILMILTWDCSFTVSAVVLPVFINDCIILRALSGECRLLSTLPQNFLTASVKLCIFEPSVSTQWSEMFLIVMSSEILTAVLMKMWNCVMGLVVLDISQGSSSQSSSPSCRRRETSSLIDIPTLERRFRSQSADSNVLVPCILIFRPFSMVILH